MHTSHFRSDSRKLSRRKSSFNQKSPQIREHLFSGDYIHVYIYCAIGHGAMGYRKIFSLRK